MTENPPSHDCCSEMEWGDRPDPTRCPYDHRQGKPVKLITLKGLLLPTALEQLNSQTSYRFCDSSTCPVVYFSTEGQTFTTQDLKVPVFQKNEEDTVPVCYCFGWTRQRIQEALSDSEQSVTDAIAAHVKAGRCGCEVNNPQGSCCLSNISHYLESLVH